MTLTDSNMDDLSKNLATITLEHEVNTNISQASNYYELRGGTKTVNFARLEKGLLLFIYIHETTKDTLHLETLLWDRRLCINIVNYGDCSKSNHQFHYEHNSPYRQPNICAFWYTQSCTQQNKCRYSHEFQNLSQYHKYILNNTDNMICKLIRFIRNFAGHYIDSSITDKNDIQELHKEIVLLMVHLVHNLSPKRNNSIDHLNLFLEATTIKQLIPQDNLLEELEKPYNVPEVFFKSNKNFTTYWYKHGMNKRSINFNQISNELKTFFNGIFVGFYEGRLRSRGASAAWD
ncbi:unnamed protein product [Adineta steineri]|uniref:C3H1-type domain-containing protein n=1 Tax=Adineta steineri TaxID=433720 RepID=A0A819FSV2_9BILA|nr:unnamed protein product [Adineta steineri]